MALTTLKVHARGEALRLVQLSGNLFVCAQQHGSCWCSWKENGRMPFDPALWGDEWERRRIRNRLHLTFTGCLGPCAAGNLAGIQIHGHASWLSDLNDPELVPAVSGYAQAMIDAGAVLALPPALAGHVYNRYLPPPAGGVTIESTDADGGEGLDRLDPVCLIDVDPATACHTVAYGGRLIAVCAPSCKRRFLADPAAYTLT